MISRILDFSLRHRLLVIAATVSVAAFGVFSFRQLPIDVFPDPSPTLVQIYTEADGMAPEEVERLISYPVEASMFGLPRVSNIRSFSTFGLSLVNVYFEEGTDIYWARQIVSPRLREISGDLPAGRRGVRSWADRHGPGIGIPLLSGGRRLHNHRTEDAARLADQI